MAILNPCCCISLQRGSKTVAIVDIILALIPLLVFIGSYVPGLHGYTGQAFSDFNIGIWTIFIVFLTADVGLSLVLFHASNERCTKNLQRWFYIRLLTAGAMVLLIIVSLCFEVSAEFILYDIFYTLYRIYTLWVVYLHVGELVHEQNFVPRKIPHSDFTVSVISKNSGSNRTGIQSEWDTPPYQASSGGHKNGAYVP
jgi:small-conductance mechanosensitive channel